MAYDIFISYRRKGGFETAKHLYDLLTKEGYRVSFDIDTLRNGDFDTELLRRIDECRDFILILSEGALDRCADPSAGVSALLDRSLGIGSQLSAHGGRFAAVGRDFRRVLLYR